MRCVKKGFGCHHPPVELWDGMLGWLGGLYVAAYPPPSGAKTIPAAFTQSTSLVMLSWSIPAANKASSNCACDVTPMRMPRQIET